MFYEIYTPSFSESDEYKAGQLYKNISIDENENQVIEFIDKQGRVILKKVQLTADSDEGTGDGHEGWLCTYYIYDDLGNLRLVVQPEGVNLLLENNWDLEALNGDILNEQCFRYEYDYRNRMIMKKVPGAGEVNMVYDKRDRLVMVQDANMQAANQWLFTKYDVLNRPVETGIWINTTIATDHRAIAASQPEGVYEYPAPTVDYDLLTQTYYDNYDWQTTSGSTFPVCDRT